MKDTVSIEDNELEEKISKTLHSTYGFNIGFAVEASKDEVIKNIIHILNMDNDMREVVEQLINNKVREHSSYKLSVEHRAKNTPKIHD